MKKFFQSLLGARGGGKQLPIVDLSAIEAARERIGDKVHRTPMHSASRLGSELGVRLHFKAELFQKTGSFKVRGVMNKLRLMERTELDRGLVSMSAGNHAAALAYGAAAVGTRATIVMPERAVPSKIEATRAYRGEVVLTDGDLMEKVAELQRDRGLVLVHPFDDPLIIAGHGTAGVEILDDIPDVQTVIVPIGGGGLISGIAAAVKHNDPKIRVIGVEPETAKGMTLALEAGKPVPIGHPLTIADGLAAPFAGEFTLRHVQEFVDDIVLVTDEQIAEALKLIMTRTKLMPEPAGAAALAAVSGKVLDCGFGERVVCVVSGGNVDPAGLREIL